jgi:hypothetical protein
VWGIPLAVSIANLAGATALFLLLRPRVESVEARPLLASLVRIAAASAVLAVAAFGTWWLLDAAFGEGLAAQVVAVGGGLAVGGLVYVGACRVFGVRELSAVLELRRGSAEHPPTLVE